MSAEIRICHGNFHIINVLANVYLKHYLEITGASTPDVIVMKWIPVCVVKYVDVDLTETANRHFLRIIERHCKKVLLP